MPRARINGLTVHYQEMGRGPAVVMIHGLFSSLAFWYFSVLPGLARDFRVALYDFRGHGYSEMPPAGYSSADLAADLHALLDHLKIDQAHLVGYSFGGLIGLQYAARHPERVISLTLVETQVPSLQPFVVLEGAARRRATRQRLRQLGFQVSYDDVPQVAISFFEEIARVRERRVSGDKVGERLGLLGQWNRNSGVFKRWVELMMNTSARSEIGNISGLTAERLRDIKQPTLAIYGEHTNCLATLQGLEERLTGFEKVIIGGAGHLHPLLEPDHFVQKLRQFIRNADLNGS